MFSGYERHSVRVNDVEINLVKGGSGPPLLLLHGYPQTHVIWHKVAEVLARHFTVIATDLRGYGDSSKPAGHRDHGNYSKRTMATDQVDVMRSFGFDRFFVVGHDRGGRVAHRMAVDYPDRVSKLVVLDIAPTLAMYEKTSMEFAIRYFHWFFLIRPFPFPEKLIGSDPEMYLKHTIGGPSAGLTPFSADAYAEYLRCISDPSSIHAMCEDYRASASIDLEHDRADITAGKKIVCDLLVLWGARNVIEQCFEPMKEWQLVANHVQGAALDCGHYIPEEIPELLLSNLLDFLV